MSDLENAVVGRRYRLRSLLSAGGFGRVWLADDMSTGRVVAVKAVLASLADDSVVRRRMWREIRAFSRLSHPHIIGLLDSGDDPLTGPFVAMEYFDGRPLAPETTQSVTLGDLLQIADQVLDALAYAHARGVLHRDLKPHNVLYRPQSGGGYEVRVLDFGLARVEGDSDMQITAAGREVVGTPTYMAPEQATGQGSASPRSDLYSMGILIWELLTGEPPFSGTNASAIVLEHVRARLPTLVPRVGITVPAGLVSVLHQVLEKEPSRRPADAAELRALLRPYAHSATATADVSSAEDATDSAHDSDVSGSGAFGTRTLFPGFPAEASTDSGLVYTTITTGTSGQDAPELLPAVSAPASDPARLWSEEGHLPGTGVKLRGSMPLLGRDSVQRHLWSRVARLHDSGGRDTLVVVGAPGSGRSAVCGWLLEASGRLGWTTNVDLTRRGASSPNALTRGVRAALGLPERPPRTLPEPYKRALWPEVEPCTDAALLDALVDAVALASARRPVLFWTGRWAELNALERTRFVTLRARIAERGVSHAVLIAATPEEYAERLRERMEVDEPILLPPLAADDLRTLTRVVFPEARSAVLDEVATGSQGSPFRALWLARIARDAAMPYPAPATAAAVVSCALDAIVRDDPEGLGPELTLGLGALAVLGRAFDDAEAEACLQAEGMSAGAAQATLDRLVEVGVLDELGTTRFRFSHPLWYAAAHDRLDTGRARRLHLWAAERPPGRGIEDPVVRARHFARGGQVEQALALVLGALRTALETFDTLRAEHLLTTSSALAHGTLEGAPPTLPSMGARLEVELGRARLLLEQGRPREALRVLRAVTRRLESLPGAETRVRDALLLEAECLLRTGDAGEARARSERALVRTEPGTDDRRHALAAWLHGASELASGNLRAARTLLLAARADLARTGQVVAELRCRIDLSVLAEAAGDAGAALRFARDAVALHTHTVLHPVHAEAQVRVAELLRRAGNWSGARDAFDAALSVYERLRLDEGIGRCAKGLAHMERVLAHHGESRRAYERAMRAFLESGDLPQAAQCQMHIGWLAAQAGEHADAERHFLRALQALHQTEDTLRVGLIHAFLARVAHARGDRDVRQRRLIEALRIDNTRPLAVPEWPRTLEELAQATLSEGDAEGARSLLRRAVQVWQFLAAPVDEARARKSLHEIEPSR